MGPSPLVTFTEGSPLTLLRIQHPVSPSVSERSLVVLSAQGRQEALRTPPPWDAALVKAAGALWRPLEVEGAVVPGQARVPHLLAPPRTPGVSFHFRPSFLQDLGSSFLQNVCHVWQMLPSLSKATAATDTGPSVDRVLLRSTRLTHVCPAGAGLRVTVTVPPPSPRSSSAVRFPEPWRARSGPSLRGAAGSPDLGLNGSARGRHSRGACR